MFWDTLTLTGVVASIVTVFNTFYLILRHSSDARARKNKAVDERKSSLEQLSATNQA